MPYKTTPQRPGSPPNATNTSEGHRPLPRATYLLLLLAADDGSPIVGRTRLEKLAFLVQKDAIERMRLGVTPKDYDFRAFHYGPFTEEVLDDMYALQNLDVAVVEGEEDASQVFQITPRGLKGAENVIASGRVSPMLVDRIRSIKRRFNQKPLGDLVEWVYHQYPEFTERSRIKSKFF